MALADAQIRDTDGWPPGSTETIEVASVWLNMENTAFSLVPIMWVWVKIKPPGDRRFGLCFYLLGFYFGYIFLTL